MKKITIECPAKLNLFLNVLENNKELGLHDIVLINQTISLFDTITIEEKENSIDGIFIESENEDIPKDINNSCYKACKLFFEFTNLKLNNIHISIKKRIPIMSGLGGESTDAAGVLLGLNIMYNTNLTKEELGQIGAKVGTDTPYFIHAGYKLVTDYGNKIEELENNIYKKYLLIVPNFGLSTKEMFKKIDSIKTTRVPIDNLLHNDFNYVIPKELQKLRSFLNNYDVNHTLSGSGSCYFIAFKNNDDIKNIYSILNNEFPSYKYFEVENVEGSKIIH